MKTKTNTAATKATAKAPRAKAKAKANAMPKGATVKARKALPLRPVGRTSDPRVKLLLRKEGATAYETRQANLKALGRPTDDRGTPRSVLLRLAERAEKTLFEQPWTDGKEYWETRYFLA